MALSKLVGWLSSSALAAGAALVTIPGAIVTAAPDPVAVYDSIDDPRPGNVPSLGFEATQTQAFGDLVQLAPGPRRLDSVTVMLSSWGCESGGWSTGDCTTAPGATFDHDLTLTLYASDPTAPTGVGAQVASRTTTFAIPYRPSADPTCANPTQWRSSGGTCFNGFATPVTFSFPAMPTVPTNLIWVVSYATTHHGSSPIGESAACYTESGGCGYDSLNVGLSQQATTAAGVDLDPAGAVTSTSTAGNYCVDPGPTGTSVLRVDTAPNCWTGYRPMAEIITLAASESATTTVVKAADTSWAFFAESTNGGQSGAYVTGPATAPVGTGSARLSVTAANQGQAFGKLFLAGTPIDRLTRFDYSSEQPAGSVAPSLQFAISYNGATTYQGRLVYEPTYSVGGPVAAGWQRWNTLTGKWWATGGVGVAQCPQSSPCTWSQVLQKFPTAQINPNPLTGAVLFKVGSGIASFTGHVDQLTIGVDDGAGAIAVTTYDFEPTAQCTSTCYVDGTTGSDLNGGTSTSDAKKTIQAAVAQVSVAGTVNVAAGRYVEDVSIAKSLVLQGAGADLSTVSGPIGGPGATITVSAPSVEIDGFNVTREGNNTTDWNDPGLNTAGVAVQGQGNSAVIRRSTFTGNRTAIDLNNSNGNSVVDNVIQNNRTGLILRNQTDATTVTGNVIADNSTIGVLFLDASGGTNSPEQSASNSTFRGNSITGNWYGGVVDRQAGGSLPIAGTTNLKNFSGNWWGTPDPVVTAANSAEPGYAAHIPVAFGGTATNPGGAPDILGVASANVDSSPRIGSGTDLAPAIVGFQPSSAALVVTATGAQVGAVSRVQEAVTDVDANGTVAVRSGTFVEPVPITITKSLSLVGPNAAISPNDAASPLTANAARVPEATLAPLAGAEVLRIGARSVTIDGFRFTDPATAGASNVAIIGAGGNSGGDASGLVVRSNVFDAITRIAVYTNGPSTMTGVTVANNRVADPTRASGCGSAPAVAASSCGHQLFNLWQADEVAFTDNVVFAPAANGDRMRVLQVAFPNAASLQADGPADNVVIARNTIRNACVYTCFSLASGVDNVSISRNDIEVDAGNIVQLRTEWLAGRVQIDHNRFVAAAGAAVVVDATASPGTDLSRVTVTRNAITSGGITNNRAAALGAPCNWWGQSAGPRSGQNVGTVTGSDSLASSDLDATCPIPVVPVDPPTPSAGIADFNPVSPSRVFDTRPGTSALREVSRVQVGPGVPLEVQLTDLPAGLVPAIGVGAVSINVTSTRSLGDGYVTVSPCDADGPVSNVNFRAGLDRANAVITAVSATGTVCFSASTPTDLAVDVNGWFKTPPGFAPVRPARVFDTRTGSGTNLRDVPKAQVQPGASLEVQLTDLLGGLVPASGVGAVSINVTATRSLGDGFVTVSPCGVDNVVSNLNFQAGDDSANLVLTPVSPTGTVCFSSSVPTDLVVDVTGWFDDPSGFTPVNPARVIDTRPGTAAVLDSATGAVRPDTVLEVKLTDLPGGLVPSSGVGAVSINVTSTRSTGDGFLTVRPCGATDVVSSVNFQAGRDRANAVLTPMSADGTICVTASQSTDVVIDLNGWFSDAPTR